MPVIKHRLVAVNVFDINRIVFEYAQKNRELCLFIVEVLDYLSLRTRKLTVAVSVSLSCVMIDEIVEISTIQRKAKTLYIFIPFLLFYYLLFFVV